MQILSEGREVLKSVKELILQPQSEIGLVRRFLQEQEYQIVDENMVEEDGKYYPMMRVLHGKMDAWTDTEYLYTFLTNNRSAGPFARRVSREQVQPGDLVQLGDQNGRFYHTPVITAVAPTIFIAAHTYDALDVPLSSYTYHTARFLRIEGVRKW